MVAYVGVRLNAPELADPTIAADLQRMDLTAIVDSATALTEPQAVRAARPTLGVNVASGGRGEWPGPNGGDHDSTLWTRAHGDAEAGQLLERLIGAPVTGRRSGPAGQRMGSDRVRGHPQLAGRAQPRRGRRSCRLRGGADPRHGPPDLPDQRPRRHPGATRRGPGPAGAGLALAHLTAVPLDTLA